MSKESKPRDRHRQSIEAVRDRADSVWCPGCGYYRIADPNHRTDCTAKRKETAADD